MRANAARIGWALSVGSWLTIATCSLNQALAADQAWTGGAGDGLWTNAANWGGTAPAAGDALFFTGSTGLTNTNNFTAETTFNGLTFNSGAGAFLLNGNSLGLGGNVTDWATATQKVNLALGLGGAGRTFTVGTGGQLEVSQPIGGSQGITKDGAGR